MKLPQSSQIPFLCALLIRDVISTSVVINPWSPNHNTCSGNGAGCFHSLIAYGIQSIVSRDCSSFLQGTITPTVTDTITATITAGGSSVGSGSGPGHGGGHRPPRGLLGIDSGRPVPQYAGAFGSSFYSSACSCLGITASTRTADPQVRRH